MSAPVVAVPRARPALVRRLGRYETLVALGFVLLGVVKVEPAPSVALLALNLLSAVEAVDLGSGMRFLGITLDLLIIAVWLTAWLTTPRRVRLVVGAYIAGAALSAVLALLAVLGAPFPGRSGLIGE